MREVASAVSGGLLIDGAWRPSSTGATIEVENPATEEVLATVADASVGDVLLALEAASTAQGSWAATPPRTRSEILRRAFAEVTERVDELATLISLEMGKPIEESYAEVRYGAEFLRWFSEEAVRVGGTWSTSPEGSTRLLTMKAPVGPTFMVTPWNFPLAMATRKVAPAVAAGCTMVLKPSELTPLTALLFADIMQRAGLPDGVLNVVTTSDAPAAAAALMRDPRLRKITFTGSTAVGRTLIAASAEHVLRVSMELGGNAPVLVFEDSDIERAVQGVLDAKMRNGGQACTAANRVLVHEAVADAFTARLVDAMAGLTVGPGIDRSTQVGPLIDARAQDKLRRLVEEKVDDGWLVLTGGKARPGRGHFFDPTVLRLAESAPVSDEELFGPVAPIETFATEDEAIRRANDTQYGLASYVFTRDLERVVRIAERLEFGMVGVNQGLISNAAAPFGGMKASGFGREGGREGIEEYLETKYVGIAP
ncbi:NAD-dependent succinate-semialdehyde dehydrogenase [Nocardioides maradonensis]